MANKYCFALDLKDDDQLIEEYKNYHKPGGVWPEVIESIKSAGIIGMEIYLVGNRLFMNMEVDETFSFEAKTQADLDNPKVQQWETLMSQFQRQLPWSDKGHKWQLMGKIFDLNEH